MSLTIRCDFCSTELPANYIRPGIIVRDINNFVAAEYDACEEHSNLIIQWLQTRTKTRPA